MIYSNKLFLKEFKTLIDNEVNSNRIVKGKITKIYSDKICVATKYSMDLTKNMSVEVNRMKASVVLIKNKNIELKVNDVSYFMVGDVVYIKNIQLDIIIQKLREIYSNILDGNIVEENKQTLRVIFGNEDSEYSEDLFFVSNLNKNQQEAVQKSLQCNKFHLIQGPPGTGKTHTIIEIIKLLYQKDYKILITAHTHIALDNILERLKDIDDNVILRIGQNDKVSSKVCRYTLENKIKQHDLYMEILEKENLIRKLSKSNNILFKSSSQVSVNEHFIGKIFSFLLPSKKNENSCKNNDSEFHTINNTDKINELKLEIENIKENIQSDILNNTKIFASTVLSSSSYLTKDIDYDYVIMDEASQVPVYLALIPLMKTSKFILIGDNKQLQPIQNNNSSYTLNKSIFNLLIDKYPNNYTFLNIQYRMNKQISDIASKLYYNGRLLTGETVKDQKISLKDYKSFLLDEEAITVIDTSNMNYDESSVSNGCCNRYEAELILNLVYHLKRNEISLDEIGIITPYKKQKIFIQNLLREHNFEVECDTIYRFQGREKDVIIVSFCKSSYKSLTKFQKKFLADENQLNVSITRSRKKLIILGNCDMIKSAFNIDMLLNEISQENILYLQDVI